MTQSERILKYLKSGKSLTVLKALNLFGVYALSQRIGDLKREGFPVLSETIRLANGKHVSRYWMVK